MAGDVRWHHGQTLAAGQVLEFKVWGELVRQSAGGLHVFLPLQDRGIDGVLHRLSDGAYFAVQVKARTTLTPAGQVHITVKSSSLVDDAALLIATLIDGDQLGRLVLVVDEATFRSLAAHDFVDGCEYLTAAFELHPGGRSRWAPFLVPRERLADRLGGPFDANLAAEPSSALEVDRGHQGFLGETEVIRRMAEPDSLALFRPFPDLETVELLVRDLGTRRWLGLQVKTSGWDAKHVENRVYLRRSSFRASTTTLICVLSWDREAKRFADDCLLIPSADISGLARVEREWLVIELQPGSTRHRRLDRYRTRLASLGATVRSMLE